MMTVPDALVPVVALACQQLAKQLRPTGAAVADDLAVFADSLIAGMQGQPERDESVMRRRRLSAARSHNYRLRKRQQVGVESESA
jgi:hypothetical protein